MSYFRSYCRVHSTQYWSFSLLTIWCHCGCNVLLNFGGVLNSTFLQSKFEDVEISELKVTKEKEDTLVEFELRLANRDENSYLEELLNDTLHNWDITGLKFEASGELVFIFILLV